MLVFASALYQRDESEGSGSGEEEHGAAMRNGGDARATI